MRGWLRYLELTARLRRGWDIRLVRTKPACYCDSALRTLSTSKKTSADGFEKNLVCTVNDLVD
jgi:hypothetical protein